MPGRPSAVARRLGLRARLMVGHMYKVYVLQSLKDKNLYIGCTSDLNKRVETHKRGGVVSTRNRLPIKLIYSEDYEDKYEAFRIERFYKTAKGKKVLKNKLSNHCGIVPRP